MERAEVQVTMTNWAIPLTPRPTVGFTGEHDVTEFEVLTTPENGVTYYLEVKAWRKEPNNILFDKESDRLTVRLTSEMLGAAGIHKAQVVAYLTDGDDTPIKKSNIFEIEVKNSINATKEVEPHYQAALEQWNQKLDELGLDVDNLATKDEVEAKQDLFTNKAKGTEITLNDSADKPIKAISIMGKSTQDGTPTIDSPIPIVDITAEEIEVTNGTDTQTCELALTLRGIPVSSGGNYTDDNNQQWICDTIERYADGSGKYIQRVREVVFDGSEAWAKTGVRIYLRVDYQASIISEPTSLFTHFALTNSASAVGNNDNMYMLSGEVLWVSPTQNGTRLSASEWKSYLASNNATLYTPYDTAVETSLTASQLAELDLSTYYPTTTITSNADIEIEYVCDTQALLDQKQDKLTAGTNISIDENVISANLPYLTDFINMADMVKRVKAGGKNFVWNTLDKGYITIRFDDGNNDLSTVADIFAEYNIPLCVAMIPDKLENISDDGRTIQEVCGDIVSNGGEILAHERVFLTDPTDYATIKTILMDSKEQLVNAGFNIRGVITPGGTGAIHWRGNNLQRFTQLFYDYSANGGDDPQYDTPQKGFGGSLPIADAKAYIDDAITNNKWYVFFAHQLVNTPEAYLREFIEYGIEQGVNFKTYAYMYDTFGNWE